MGLFAALKRLFAPARPAPRPSAPRTPPSATGPLATVEVPLPRADGLRISYAPRKNGAPDGGEVVW